MMKVLCMDGKNNYQSSKLKKWKKFWPQGLVKKLTTRSIWNIYSSGKKEGLRMHRGFLKKN
jgi:hypothetical protein